MWVILEDLNSQPRLFKIRRLFDIHLAKLKPPNVSKPVMSRTEVIASSRLSKESR